MIKKRILVARLSRGSMLQARDNKIAELNKDEDQILERYSDTFVESGDTIFHYVVVNVDFNTTAFAGFETVDAGPIIEKAKLEIDMIKTKENVETEKDMTVKEPAPETPAKVSGTEIVGKNETPDPVETKVQGVDSKGGRMANDSEVVNKEDKKEEKPGEDNASESTEKAPETAQEDKKDENVDNTEKEEKTDTEENKA